MISWFPSKRLLAILCVSLPVVWLTGCAASRIQDSTAASSVSGSGKSNPPLAHDFFLRARTMELEGNPKVALGYYRIAFRYDPENRDLCFMLLDRLRESGKIDSAIALGKSCLALAGKPASREYQSVGQAYLRKEDAVSAAEYYREAVALDDDGNDDVLAWLHERGLVLERMNTAGWCGVVCPNADAHTNDEIEGRYFPLTRAYRCLHAHCADWDSQHRFI